MTTNTVERLPRALPVRRLSLITLFFISFQFFIPSYAVPIAPQTDGFLYDVGAIATVTPGVNVNSFDTAFLNQYVTQSCGNNCTIEDYKEAILISNNPTYKIQIPQTLIPNSNLITPAYTTYTFPANYTAFDAYQQFRYSSNQPVDMNGQTVNAFLTSTEAESINPKSVVIGNTAWGDCPAFSVCLTWGVGWEVTQTPPSDFTPGTMKGTALYLISTNDGKAFHYMAQSPIQFAPNTSANGNRINGWQWKYGNFGMRWPQTDLPQVAPNEPNIWTNDAVELIGVGATYTSTNGQTKWAFLHQYNDLPIPPTYIRIKTTDIYCDLDNNCTTKIKTTDPEVYNPTIQYAPQSPLSEPNKGKVNHKVELEVNSNGTWGTPTLLVNVNIPTLENADTTTKACALGDEKCVIALYKATENGYRQCDVGNTNTDCSAWIPGANLSSPYIADFYQCRINGVVQPLEKCTQLQGNYSGPVPQYADPDASTAPLSCAPSGLSVLNPLAYVETTACVWSYLFIPKKGWAYYADALKLNLEGTVLLFPSQFINEFVEPLINNTQATPNPELCLGLGITVPTDTVLEYTIFKDAQSDNLVLYPFQACNANAQTLASVARNIEQTLIYLLVAFISIRVIANAIGVPLPFINNKGKTGGIGNI